MVEQNNDTDEREVYEFVTKGLHVTFIGLYYYYTRSASQTFVSEPASQAFASFATNHYKSCHGAERDSPGQRGQTRSQQGKVYHNYTSLSP